MYVCVCRFTDVAVFESTIISPHLLSLKAWRNKHGATEGPRLARMMPHVDALETFTWQNQAVQDVGTPKTEKERCVYICDYRFDPSPSAGPFVIQTKGGTLEIFRHFTVQLSTETGSSWLCSQRTLLPRRSHVSHWEQFTTIAAYFRKPLI